MKSKDQLPYWSRGGITVKQMRKILRKLPRKLQDKYLYCEKDGNWITITKVHRLGTFDNVEDCKFIKFIGFE